jgi:hypothetical protein
MNELIHVFGHPRSGNNFILGSIYINFYDGEELPGRFKLRGFRNHKNKVVPGAPWAQLHGGHHLRKPPEYPLNRCLYVKRDVLDTAFSVYTFRNKKCRRKQQPVTFDRYIKVKWRFPYWNFPKAGLLKNKNIIEAIKEHHRVWDSLGIFTVTYEEMFYHPIRTLNRIKKYFGLHNKKPLRKLKNKVGWKAAKARPDQGWKELFDEI